jgi:hypothetical protein
MYRQALVAFVAVALEATASAQGVVVGPHCGGGFLGLAYLMARSETTAVFSGTVATARHPDAAVIVTFDVDRVWKGAISKRTVVYRPNPVTSDERQVFALGERYVVVAHRLTAAEREQFRADTSPPEVLGVGLCGDGSRSLAFAQPELIELGAGRPPQ